LEIQYYNRRKEEIEVEKVYGDGLIKWMYESFSGKVLSNLLVKGPLSAIYGATQSSKASANKIPKFIENFKINMDEYKPEEGQSAARPYSSFNKFFIRQFKDGKRPFPTEKNKMGAFAEARYYGYESISDDETIPVKGKYLNATELLDNSNWDDTFKDGPLLLARLCPVDYHRFHYPDDGIVLDHYKVRGELHSVNPLALREKADIFSQNLREVTILETKNFGKIAYVEVGAMMVGKIKQSTDLTTFKKGDEKGYFLFGGSTVIIIGEKGKWKPAADICERTQNSMETYIQLGEALTE
jgi:phosphatidylserine decarboxylase